MNKILKILLDEGEIEKKETVDFSPLTALEIYVIPGVRNFYFYEISGQIRLHGLEEIKTQTEWDKVKDIVDYVDEILRKHGVRK